MRLGKRRGSLQGADMVGRAVSKHWRLQRVWRAFAPYTLVGALALSLGSGALARADVDGDTPSPGSCSYPAVGAFGLDGVAQHYVCDYPTEVNGSRHHCVYGGAAALVGANVGLLVFSASIGSNLGVLQGVCYWACPDGSVAGEPNPVQTWQGSAAATVPVRRSSCVSLAPNPVPA